MNQELSNRGFSMFCQPITFSLEGWPRCGETTPGTAKLLPVTEGEGILARSNFDVGTALVWILHLTFRSQNTSCVPASHPVEIRMPRANLLCGFLGEFDVGRNHTGSSFCQCQCYCLTNTFGCADYQRTASCVLVEVFIVRPSWPIQPLLP
jgi:hypothetical protein